MGQRIDYEDDQVIIGVTWPDADPANLTPFTTYKAGVTVSNRVATLVTKAHAALAANQADLASDAQIQNQAATITGTSGTLTLAQLSNAVRLIAQGVSVLAGNDLNTKRELDALCRLLGDPLDTLDHP